MSSSQILTGKMLELGMLSCGVSLPQVDSLSNLFIASLMRGGASMPSDSLLLEVILS